MKPDPKPGEMVFEVRPDGVSVSRVHPDDMVCGYCMGSGRKKNEESPLRYVWMSCPHCGGSGKPQADA